MALRVPRTPETRAVGRSEGYARAAAPLDYSGITQPLKQFAREIDEEQKKLESFELQKRLVDETNQLMLDFDERKQAAPLGAAGFTDTVLSEYQTRHEAILNEYWEKGYDTEGLQDFALRLGGLRQGIGGQALAFQGDSVRQLASKEMGGLTVSLSQYVTRNPDGYVSAEEQLRESVSIFPGLTEQDKVRIVDENLAVIRQGASKGLAMQNPELVISALDPEGFTAPRTTPAGSGGAYETLTGWQGVATTVADQLGLDPTEVAAVMSFESAGTFDPTIMGGEGGKYMGLIQFGPAERAKYNINVNSTPEDWTNAILGFMKDRGFKPGMGLEDFYSTILTGGPGRYDAKDVNGTSVRNAVPRILNEHRENAAKWLSAGQPIQTIDPGASTAEQAPDLSTLVPTEGADGVPNQFDPASIVTGNPVLDALNGPERLQVLGWAREQQSKVIANIRGSMDIAIENSINANLSGDGYAGPPITREEVIQVYGPVEGEQRWAQVEGAAQAGQVIQRIRTASPATIEAELERLRPDPTSPTYTQDLKMFEAAGAAADKVMKDREEDPAAYVFRAFPEIGSALERAETSEQRRAVYAKMARAYDNLDIPEEQRVYQTKEMMERLADTYRTATAGDKFNIIASSIAEMGPQVAGRTLGRAGGTEVAQDMVMYATLARTPNFQQTFMDVLRGKEIIAKDPARKPSADTINTNFAAGISTAINNLNPDVSRSINEAAAALYVLRGGTTLTGGVLSDKKLYDTALREALGGTSNAQTGMVDMTEWGKVTDFTILPPGISKTQFENWLDQLEPGDLTALTPTRKPPVDRSGRPLSVTDIVDEGVFVLVAPGRYGIKLRTDGKWVADSSGKRFIMNIALRPR